MNNKLKKILKLFIIIILIILCIKIFFLNNLFHKTSTEDYLFLKLLSNKNQIIKFKDSDSLKDIGTLNNTSNIVYEFKVSQNKFDLKTIELSDVIAPGKSGQFDLILKSNEDSKYKIQFNSISQKPKNLKFKAIINDNEIVNVNALEELSEYLKGNIKKNKNIKIKINWYWDYENGYNSDLQDTLDAKNIKKYQFDINVIGEDIA